MFEIACVQMCDCVKTIITAVSDTKYASCSLYYLSNIKQTDDNQLSYRRQVIGALVQRYIESARREFEEAKRKGNADTDTNQSDKIFQCPMSKQTFANITGL